MCVLGKQLFLLNEKRSLKITRFHISYGAFKYAIAFVITSFYWSFILQFVQYFCRDYFGNTGTNP